MKFAAELAAGPTVAHGATKQLVRAYLDGGIAAADAATAAIAGPLFDTEDLRTPSRASSRTAPARPPTRALSGRHPLAER